MNREEIFEFIKYWDNLELFFAEVNSMPSNFKLLLDIALNDDRYISWRAAYLVDQMHDKDSQIILPYLDAIIENLKTQKHAGKKRHFLRMLTSHEISEKHSGFMVEYCFKAFQAAKEPVAVKVHAMQILFNIAQKEPDLKEEIALVIEHEMEYHATAGILSRGKKLLNKLRNN